MTLAATLSPFGETRMLGITQREASSLGPKPEVESIHIRKTRLTLYVQSRAVPDWENDMSRTSSLVSMTVMVRFYGVVDFKAIAPCLGINALVSQSPRRDNHHAASVPASLLCFTLLYLE